VIRARPLVIPLTSKFAPSWLFNPFRSVPSERRLQPSPHQPCRPDSNTPTATSSTQPIQLPPPAKDLQYKFPRSHVHRWPVNIKAKNTTTRSTLSRTFEKSPLFRLEVYTTVPPTRCGTPPREEANFGKRRSGLSSFSMPAHPPLLSLDPTLVLEPIPPDLNHLSPIPASLARRWQHILRNLRINTRSNGEPWLHLHAFRFLLSISRLPLR